MTGHHRYLLAMTICAALGFVAGCDTGAPGDTGSAPVSPGPTATVADSERPAAGRDEPARAVVAETLPYAEVGEQLVYGYFVFPADMIDPLPGIIFIHERWGLDDRSKAMADRIAGQGYVVLAVDLYGGRTVADARGARDIMVNIVEKPEPTNENLRQAFSFLRQSGQAPAIGVVGWSLGGSWALNAALLMPEQLNAAVMYYGQVTSNEERLAVLSAPVLGLFGGDDKGVTEDAVHAFEQSLTRLRKDFEIEIYPGVGHAFADPASANFNADAAAAAWSRVTEFLARHLSASPE